MTLFGTQHLELFVTSGLLLNIAPGQDNFYIVGRSVSQGRRAGLLSAAGILSGCVVHTIAVAFGVSAILAASAQAFVAIKIAGAIYLAYLGMQMLRARSDVLSQPSFSHESDWTIFRAGVMSNVLNPATALFFLAFLPQFVAPDAGSRLAALLFLGGVFIFNGALWCLLLVWSASAVSRRLRQGSASGLWLKRATGALFVGLGVRLAVSR